MNKLMATSMVSVILIAAVATYIEIKNYTPEYISDCCKSSYNRIETINRYNKKEVKIYCLNCKKWCDLIKK